MLTIYRTIQLFPLVEQNDVTKKINISSDFIGQASIGP